MSASRTVRPASIVAQARNGPSFPPVATSRLPGGAARAKARIAVSGARACARVPATTKGA
jgi:hypothetical protein